MSSNDLNIFQQIYLQVFGADLAGMFVGPEWLLQKALNKAIDKLMSTTLKAYGWDVVWGPRVWKDKSDSVVSGLDNAWFASCAKKVQYPDGAVKDTYVIAIAGTAVFSKHDWLVEDLGVNTVVDFDAWPQNWSTSGVSPPSGVQNPPTTGKYAAYGTSSGVFELLSNTSPKGRPGEGTTLLDFLKGLPADCRVIFGGHSLGGALSPTITLGLLSSGVLGRIDDPKNNVLVLPAAGASPGEGNFQKAFKELLPSRGTQGYQIWNEDLYNTLDIVPMSWCTDASVSPDRNLDRIATIYGTMPEGLTNSVKSLIEKEKASANSSGVLYIPLPGNAFTGTVPAKAPSNWLSLILEIVKQHTTAYHDQIKVKSILAPIYRELTAIEGVRKQTAGYVASRYPVLRQAAPDEILGDERNNVYPYDMILED